MPLIHKLIVLAGVAALPMIAPVVRLAGHAAYSPRIVPPDVTITMREYAFEMDSMLSSGQHVVALRNTGHQAHLVFLTRLAPEKTSRDVIAWLEHQEQPKPGDVIVASAAVKGGKDSVLTLNLAPGRYSLICTVRGWWGRPHYKSGMWRDIVVADNND